MKTEFNLSEKRHLTNDMKDSDVHYHEEDVKEFIKLLKCNLFNMHLGEYEGTKEATKQANKDIREMIDKLAGGKLIENGN